MSGRSLPYALIGATGRQGQHVVDELLERGVPVRAIVRDTGSDAARRLAGRGVEVVHGDQEDPASLVPALTGVEALWFMTTFDGPDGTDGEARRGIGAADAARAARVPRVVYSSVGGAERRTGIPHFESKRAVERRLSDTLDAAFVRPVFFMENLSEQLVPDEGGEIVLRMPMPGDVPMQMVSARDVGRAAARWLIDPTAVRGDAVELGVEELTLDETAHRIGEVWGAPTRFEQIPVEWLPDADLQAMFRWFAHTGRSAYAADFDASAALLPDRDDIVSWLVGQRAGAERTQGARR